MPEYSQMTNSGCEDGGASSKVGGLGGRFSRSEILWFKVRWMARVAEVVVMLKRMLKCRFCYTPCQRNLLFSERRLLCMLQEVDLVSLIAKRS